MLLTEAVELFLARDIAPSTVHSHRRDLASFMATVAPTLPVEAVTEHDINRWIRLMREQDTRYATHPRIPTTAGGLSPMTVEKRIKTVRALFNWLVRIGELETSPFRGVTTRRAKRPTATSKAVTRDELQAIHRIALARAHLGKPKALAIFLFLVDTGCRAGEAAGLTLERLHLDGGYAWVLGKGDTLRPVFFVEETAEAIRRWLAVRPDKPGDTRVWQMKADSLSQVIYRMAQTAGIPRPIHAHAIRHAVGRTWAQSVPNEQLTQLKLGHENPSVTIQHYYNSRRDDVQRMSQQLGLAALYGTQDCLPAKPATVLRRVK